MRFILKCLLMVLWDSCRLLKRIPRSLLKMTLRNCLKKVWSPRRFSITHTFDVEGIPIEYFGGCVLTKARLELPVTPADNAARVNRDLCSPEHKHKSIHRVECFKKIFNNWPISIIIEAQTHKSKCNCKACLFVRVIGLFFHALHSSSWRFDFQIIHCPLSMITERATKDMPAQGGH